MLTVLLPSQSTGVWNPKFSTLESESHKKQGVRIPDDDDDDEDDNDD